jgi:TPR repeat protein
VETTPLLEQGNRLFAVGNIASARLFYERAADSGDGQAALRLGETYDPAFLQRTQLRVAGNRALAVYWYRRARELGTSEAEILLKDAQNR